MSDKAPLAIVATEAAPRARQSNYPDSGHRIAIFEARNGP